MGSCTIQTLFSIVLFTVQISNHVKRSKKKDDEEDVHHSDVCHKEIAVKESSVKEPSLLHRKHHLKQKASAANGLFEEMDSQMPIAPGFPPQEIELSERGLNSEYCSSSSIQKKNDEEDVHHSDVCHEEIAVKESLVKEPSLLHRKYHAKKPSGANDLSGEVYSQKPISPGFPPQKTELSERGLNSNEHCLSSSIQDASLPNVHINTYPTQNAAQIAHLTNEHGPITMFVNPGERAESMDLEDGTRGGSQHILSRSTSMISAQDSEMKNHFKLVCGMFTISCGASIANFVDLLGKNNFHHHKALLQTAYTFCVYASCIICLCVIAIYLLCPHTVHVVRIIKFITWMVLATVIYAFAFIICLTTPVGVAEEVAVLVLPILPLGLVGLIRAKYKSN